MAILACHNGLMTSQLVLYSREECHLCELAAKLLRSMGVEFEEIDIDRDSSLEARYGIKVPVLAQPAQCREICFPFGEEEVKAFLDQ